MDAVGSNIVISHRTGELLRIIPRMHEDINEEWISDKARFSYDGLKRQRLIVPMIKDTKGVLQPCEWEEALYVCAQKLRQTPKDAIAVVAGGLVDAESLLALKDLMNKFDVETLCTEEDFPDEGVGTDLRCNYIFNDRIAGIGIIHKLRDTCSQVSGHVRGRRPRICRLKLFMSVHARIAKTDMNNFASVLNILIFFKLCHVFMDDPTEDADVVLLVGTNPRFEAPVLNARIRKTWLHYDLRVGLVGSKVDLTYDYDHVGSSVEDFDKVVNGKHEFCRVLKAAKKPMIIVGSGALQGKHSGGILESAKKLAGNLSAGLVAGDKWKVLNILQRAASQVAALDLGYSGGVGKIKRMQNKPELLYMLGADEGSVTRDMLDKRAFVIYQGHTGDMGADMADMVLPGAAYTEKEGTYVNTEGRAQKSYPAVPPAGMGRVDWKIIRALSEIAGRTLPYDTLEDIHRRMNEIAPHLTRYGEVEEANFFKEALALGSEIRSPPLSGSLEIGQKRLADYYMTNSVTRASETMAECVRAAKQYRENPYLEPSKI